MRTLKRPGWRILLPFWLALLVCPAWASDLDAFNTGLAAYDAGDYGTSVEMWQPLAARGHSNAQVALAGLYAQGLGVPHDEAAATRWYETAARDGHLLAQVNAGERYALGRGTKRDPVRGAAWLAVAADQGHAWAQEQHAAMVKNLNDDQLREAEALAKQLVEAD